MSSMLRRRWGRIALMFAIPIVAALVVARSSYKNTVIRAQEQALRTNLLRLRDGIDQFAAATGRCPDSLRSLQDARYIRAVPIDPITKSATTWRFTQSAIGCDVKSGSPQRALDGTRYAEW